ncbi:hypothetical protein [Mycoplasmopsis agassizii]|uniref:Uncharacterized protein n=1 Tax=Mycoplasmopsis agassizii TaxID=33922 RepID=A0ABX4H6I2_9BACT|nr:hypothetical protein [Mycoplasmopsis agassizii]PAF55515.1 hypothetical protein CJF60_02445 [Mycoplasmopsis agassizii]SMC17994.1 hypothetical protein SAMN02745179_00582 [Mycoplasmopsis agassizii]
MIEDKNDLINETKNEDIAAQMCSNIKKAFSKKRSVRILKNINNEVDDEIELQVHLKSKKLPKTGGGGVKRKPKLKYATEEYVKNALSDLKVEIIGLISESEERNKIYVKQTIQQAIAPVEEKVNKLENKVDSLEKRVTVIEKTLSAILDIVAEINKKIK